MAIKTVILDTDISRTDEIEDAEQVGRVHHNRRYKFLNNKAINVKP